MFLVFITFENFHLLSTKKKLETLPKIIIKHTFTINSIFFHYVLDMKIVKNVDLKYTFKINLIL